MRTERASENKENKWETTKGASGNKGNEWDREGVREKRWFKERH